MNLQMLISDHGKRLGKTKVELVRPESPRTVSFGRLAAVIGVLCGLPEHLITFPCYTLHEGNLQKV
jgi:hypothetical protein